MSMTQEQENELMGINKNIEDINRRLLLLGTDADNRQANQISKAIAISDELYRCMTNAVTKAFRV